MTRTARAVLGAIVFVAAFGWISAAGAQASRAHGRDKLTPPM